MANKQQCSKFELKVPVVLQISCVLFFWANFHSEPEVLLECGAELCGHVGHAGVEGPHQPRVERQQVRPVAVHGEQGLHQPLPVDLREERSKHVSCRNMCVQNPPLL